MSNRAYTSINSVLYDLSTILPEDQWNKTHMLEWAYKALHKMNVHQKYEPVVIALPVEDHKCQLPSNIKYINQVAYKIDISQSDLEYFKDIMNLSDEPWNVAVANYMENPSALPQAAVNSMSSKLKNTWRPMRLSSHSFLKGLASNVSMFADVDWDTQCCDYEYVVDHNMCLTTTLPNGVLLISYMRIPTCENGEAIIPDDEDLKEAIVHYVLYRLYMKRALMNEEGSFRERDYHLSRFEILKMKVSGKLNSPSIDEMENIKAQRDHLVPRVNRYDGFFSGLNKQEVEPSFTRRSRF